MKLFYDTEFVESGPDYPVQLISIGMLAEDGREYYAIDESCNWWMVTHHPWLSENVLPSLPVIYDGAGIEFDEAHRDYRALKPRSQIADELRDFILAAPEPQLWADWCAYDHVVLCQLWGTMVQLPEGIPMWTHEFRQAVERAGNPPLPSLSGITEHNALDDARELKFRYKWLADHHG